MENQVPKKKRSLKKAVGTALLCLLVGIAFLCFFSAAWYVNVYGRIGFDSVLFTLMSDLGGVQSDLVTKYLTGAAVPAVLCSIAVCLVLFLQVKVNLFGKIRLLPLRRWVACLLSVALSLGLIVHAAFNVQLVDYLISHFQKTELYEREYRDPNDVTITFPEEKRNLIYIILESMETSYLSRGLGGGLSYNLIPELTELAQENINFSHNATVGGFREVPGASWTIGAMVSQTSGVPLVTPDGISDWQNGYGKDGVFLPGLTNLGNILEENGYYQTLMVGSDANFGGRKTYYTTHDVDAVYDIYTARKDGIVAPNYFEWWGMEDKYLFEYAKEELTKISAQKQPFAFTMLTVDTHHIGGYKCEYCGSTYEENYENVISCSSRQVVEFVRWLQQQPFYENTTIIVTGDHCSMDKGYFSRNVDENYVRHVYNCFINAAATPMRTENREFCALDMFPTTLAAMGCEIEGNRLGLGTDLFSASPTLIEIYGYTDFAQELSKRSPYYSEHFYTADKLS